MNKRKLKTGIVGIIILGLVGYLIYTGLRDTMTYYFTVGELLAKDKSIYGQGIRIGGLVSSGSVKWNPASLQLNFLVTDGKNNLPVIYKGVVPDTFREGGEVVVEGRYTQEGIFWASQLFPKCPSKYVAKAKG